MGLDAASRSRVRAGLARGRPGTSSSDDEFRELAGAVVNLARRAAAEYTPIVDSLVAGRSLDVGEVEWTLYGLLDFCFDPEVLLLFRRLCVHYSRIDPAATGPTSSPTASSEITKGSSRRDNEADVALPRRWRAGALVRQTRDRSKTCGKWEPGAGPAAPKRTTPKITTADSRRPAIPETSPVGSVSRPITTSLVVASGAFCTR